jgi:hypothetical protein
MGYQEMAKPFWILYPVFMSRFRFHPAHWKKVGKTVGKKQVSVLFLGLDMRA